jgi:hypothetical protein
MASIKKLMEWDVWPTLENTWDLLPFSFVVDWFLHVSTLLSNIDRLVYEQYLRVCFYERSDKFWISITPEYAASAFGIDPARISCAIHGKVYYRRVSERPQLGILDGWSPTLPAPQNYVDSVALLVQSRF